MTFERAINGLDEVFSTGIVYGIRGYDDGKEVLGLRSSYYNDLRSDPVVDGEPFMITGEARGKITHAPIETIRELGCIGAENIRLRLKAHPGYYPTVTIDLGYYDVDSIDIVEGGRLGIAVIKMAVHKCPEPETTLAENKPV